MNLNLKKLGVTGVAALSLMVPLQGVATAATTTSRGTVAPTASASSARRAAASPAQEQAVANAVVLLGHRLKNVPKSMDSLPVTDPAVQALLAAPTSAPGYATPNFSIISGIKCLTDVTLTAASIGLSVGEVRAAIFEIRDIAGGYSAIISFIRFGDFSALSSNAVKIIEQALGLPALLADCTSTFG